MNPRSNTQNYKLSRLSLLAMICALLMSPVALFAQNSVRGTVTDANGAMAGVAVVVQGTQVVAITDGNGFYTIRANENDVLEFTYFGYDKVTERVGQRASIDVKMVEATLRLDEVVVVGYGTQRKSDVTGAVSSVRESDLSNRSTPDAAAAMQGKIAGVQVLNTTGKPGEGAEIRIRGYSSNTTGATSPLYVVDGLIVDGISYLDPQMIESIEVLKDAASAAIYGAQAGNGVVLITTKKGKQGEGKIFYNYLFVNNRLGNIPKVLNAAQFMEFKKEETGVDYPNTYGVDTDWFDATFEPSNMQSHTLGFQGANERGNMFLSVNYIDNQGMIKGPYDYYQRLSGQINAEYKIKPWLTVGSNNSIEKWDRVSMGDRSDWQTPLLGVLRSSPLTPVWYDSKDALPASLKNIIDNPSDIREVLMDPDNGKYYGVTTGLNIGSPLISRDRAKNNKNQGINVRGATYLNFNPIKGLVFTSRLGYRISQNFTKNYTTPYFATANAYQNNYIITASQRGDWYYQWDNFINYAKSFGKNNIGAMVGMSYVQNEQRGVNGGLEGTDPLTGYTENFRYLTYVNGSPTRTLGETNNTSANMAYFGRLTWSYDNRYNLQANFRADAFDASKLAEKQRWGYFPSFSAGWTISNEAFVKDFAESIQMNNLKIRASWGQNGNINILRDYRYNATISAPTGVMYQYVPGETVFVQGRKPGGLVNEDMKWETLEQIDIGLESRFLKNRLTFTMDYFRKETKDLLVAVSPIAEMGVTTNTYINAGNIVNSGLEFEVGWNDKIGDFKYSVSANLSTLSNEVTYLDPSIQRITGAGAMNSHFYTQFEKGYPVYYLRGYKFTGVASADGYYKKADGTNGAAYKGGDPLFEDLDGDGNINDKDLTMMGSGIPDITYGVTVNLAYKGFDLNIFGTGVAGNEIFLYYYDATADMNNNLLAMYYENRWTPQNTNASMPRGLGMPGGRKTEFLSSSANVFSGSFFRIKQIQLGYTLPTSLLSKIHVSSLRVFASLDDFFTITSYPGFDPEASSQDTGSGLGVDKGNYPISKKITFGINLSF